MNKILIIEDESSIAELEKDYLELSDFEVVIESDGSSGAAHAIDEDFDLIILDLMLPGMDGFEICSLIREKKNTPIIIVSAKKDDIDKIRGLGIGADDYMTKPFSPSELVARVKAHLSRYKRLTAAGTKENEIIEIRGLKIDRTARRVYINGEEKNFTTKEFDLLAFLAQNPNHVYSKEELFKEIWELESVGDIATVTVHIKKIREKIEESTAKPQYIETDGFHHPAQAVRAEQIYIQNSPAFEVIQHIQPEFAALMLSDPYSEDVLPSIHGDPQNHVSRLCYIPVIFPYLVVDGVHKDEGIHQ